jgi:L-fuconolactonase
MIRIDAHQHFWRIARGDYGWLTAADHPVIHRDFLPADLLPLLKDAQIHKTILVQAAPSVVETEFLLELSAEAGFVAGVVGWVDFEASDAAGTIDRLARNISLLGLRPMIQDLADDDWMLSARIESALAAMAANNLRFDALVKARHLPNLRKFLDRHQELPVVIDHGAKPDIARGDVHQWQADIRAIARDTHAFCKLSGLVTEARKNCDAHDIRPVVETLCDAFGADRLMWGSDWPVLNEAWDSAGAPKPDPYTRWHAMAEELTRSLTGSARKRVFGGTAAEFYGVA